ncbi:ester cyclase [Methylocella sp.]|uniref:ester cyclase n=1 Tax=Methylocella sp. TaxID=1978226 RepID=UPI0037837D76
MTAPAIESARADEPKLIIDEVVVADAVDAARLEQIKMAARHFYQFWDTGDPTRLNDAAARDFTDHTLPPGRPQGPDGPAFASRSFRAAVPDLRVEIRKMIIAGDYVTVHMVFTGHFTGRFGDASGQGQKIEFIATDLIRVRNGRVADNWHVEDNLTLLRQMGVARLLQ